MAARKNLTQVQRTRDKIQASQLINRLQDHILTHPGDPDYDQYILTQTQVTAALGLLKKTLPDLSSQRAEVTEPVRVVVEYIKQDRPVLAATRAN